MCIPAIWTNTIIFTHLTFPSFSLIWGLRKFGPHLAILRAYSCFYYSQESHQVGLGCEMWCWKSTGSLQYKCPTQCITLGSLLFLVFWIIYYRNSLFTLGSFLFNLTSNKGETPVLPIKISC